MSDSTPHLEQIATAQAQKEVTANGLFDALSPAAFGGRHAEACSGLTWGYYGGRWGGSVVANGTLALDASAVNEIVLERATGAVSLATPSDGEWDDADNYARLYSVTTSATLVASYEDHRVGPGGLSIGAAPPATTTPVLIQIACSDETTDLTTGTKVKFRAPYAFTLTAVRASLSTAATGGTLLTVDVNEGVSSVLSTKLTFDASETTTTTAATPAVISDANIADDAEISIDIDSVGSTLPGKGLKVTLIGTKP